MKLLERDVSTACGLSQMLHLLLLKDLVKEDNQRRVEGEDQSVVFPLADHVFGLHGTR